MTKRPTKIVPKKLSSVHSTSPILIAITGTPGSGKTALARKLSLFMNATYIDLNSLAISRRLSVGFDKARNSHIINELGLFRALKPLLKTNRIYMLDSHLSHLLPSSKVSFVIVVRVSLPALKKRLEQRGYSASKVAENVQAELFGVCAQEAWELGHKTLEISSAKPFSKAVLSKLSRQIKNLSD